MHAVVLLWMNEETFTGNLVRTGFKFKKKKNLIGNKTSQSPNVIYSMRNSHLICIFSQLENKCSPLFYVPYELNLFL